MSSGANQFVPSWGAVKRNRQALKCLDADVAVGTVDCGLGALDDEAPAVLIDYIRVVAEAPYRGGVVANWLVDRLVERWPGLHLRGGPLHDDDPPGPAFRLRTWERGIEFHDGGCELVRTGLEDPPLSCECLLRLTTEVSRRDRANRGSEPTSELN